MDGTNDQNLLYSFYYFTTQFCWKLRTANDDTIMEHFKHDVQNIYIDIVPPQAPLGMSPSGLCDMKYMPCSFFQMICVEYRSTYKKKYLML